MMNISEKDLVLLFKGLVDRLLFLMQVVIILLIKIRIENIFLQDLGQKFITLKLIVDS